MTTTSVNPGAFRAMKVRGLRAMVSRAASLARKGEYRAAAYGSVVDALNLFELRAGAMLTKRYRCNCCGHEAHWFQHKADGDRISWNSACPGCDSRSRHRGLAVLLPRLLDERRPKRVLHFAPEPVLRRFFEGRALTYETADLFLEDATHTGIDLQALPFAERSYDFIVCNHVLEHVADDRAAIRELARVLSPSGVAVLTVPGDFERAETVVFHGELQNGHYRDYGLDVVPLLEIAFSRVTVLDLHELAADAGGLSLAVRPLDLVFVCEP